jgi:hypothetical protein
MSRWSWLFVVLFVTGCASWPSWPTWLAFMRPGATLLERADRQVMVGDYAAAVQTYDVLLARYPDDPEALRARTSRDVAAEIVRLRAELSTRDTELSRLRQEVARLRDDLENLKRMDMQLERGKK